jgi:hypothetical protein
MSVGTHKSELFLLEVEYFFLQLDDDDDNTHLNKNLKRIRCNERDEYDGHSLQIYCYDYLLSSSAGEATLKYS